MMRWAIGNLMVRQRLLQEKTQSLPRAGNNRDVVKWHAVPIVDPSDFVGDKPGLITQSGHVQDLGLADLQCDRFEYRLIRFNRLHEHVPKPPGEHVSRVAMNIRKEKSRREIFNDRL